MLETAAIIASITIPGTALLITVVKARKSSKEDEKNERGLCPAHQDLVSGMAAFRTEVRNQFSTLTTEIMELCKDIKRG